MSGVPSWFWLVVSLMVLGGLGIASTPRLAARVNRLPIWFCVLLIAAALVGIWWLFQTQLLPLVSQMASDF